MAKKRSKMKKAVGKANSSPSTQSQRSSSRLLQLPKNLRDDIYSWVFRSTRLTFGENPEDDHVVKRAVKKSRLHSLSLLYTCRQVHREIGSHWIGWILFNFQSGESLLDVLTELPDAKVAAIRHVRAPGEPVMLSLVHDDVYFRLAAMLRLVPRLQLDTLTVIGGTSGILEGGSSEVDYKIIDDLVSYGAGWKELHFVLPNSGVFAFPKKHRFDVTYHRKPQPEDWTTVLLNRDGRDSNPSVTIFRTKERHDTTPIYKGNRELFVQTVAPQDFEEFGHGEDASLHEPGEIEKEVLVIIKRGRDVDVTKASTDPPAKDDMRALLQDDDTRTWKALRQYYTEGAGEDEDMDALYGEYDSDDEWTPFAAPSIPPWSPLRDRYGNDPYEIEWSTQALFDDSKEVDPEQTPEHIALVRLQNMLARAG